MKFAVAIPNQMSVETVEADYLVIIDGHLILRRMRSSSNHYPQVVKAFAPGAWSTVEPREA